MTIPSTPSTLAYVRDNVRDLLNEFDVADALASYYTLYHEGKRTTIYMHRQAEGQIDGFLTRCQTGIDLFRPLVTMRVRGSGPIASLVTDGLQPGMPYLLVLPAYLVERVETHLTLTSITRLHILRLDPEKFRPEMNVLVVHKADRYGNPRTEIRRDDATVAAAGVNWRSPLFAEIYVNVENPHRGRGLGWAVVNGLVADLIKLQITPLYAVDQNNTSSRELAKRVGFVDSGAREVVAGAVRRGDD